jgi:hypothetical protein
MYATMKAVLVEEIATMRAGESFGNGASLARRVEKFSRMGYWKEAVPELEPSEASL